MYLLSPLTSSSTPHYRHQVHSLTTALRYNSTTSSPPTHFLLLLLHHHRRSCRLSAPPCTHFRALVPLPSSQPASQPHLTSHLQRPRPLPRPLPFHFIPPPPPPLHLLQLKPHSSIKYNATGALSHVKLYTQIHPATPTSTSTSTTRRAGRQLISRLRNHVHHPHRSLTSRAQTPRRTYIQLIRHPSSSLPAKNVLHCRLRRNTLALHRSASA